MLKFKKNWLFKSLVSLFLLLFAWDLLAQAELEGSLRLRASFPQLKESSQIPLYLQGRLLIKTSLQISNQLKTRLYFLSSNSYKNNFSLEDSFKFYPSADWLINEDMELRLGRNLYKNNFHQILSFNDYEPFFYVFDGLFLEYNTKILNVNFWTALLPKTWVGPQLTEEFKYGFGFFLDLRAVSDYIEDFNAHVAYLADSFFKEEAPKISRYGLGITGLINPFNLIYSFIAIGHGEGVQFNLQEKMYHFRLSYSYPKFLNTKLFVGYHQDSEGYRPWLYDRHKNAGLMDMFLWGNLTYYFMGLNLGLKNVLNSSLLELQLVFYNLSSTQKGAIKMGYFGSSLNNLNDNITIDKGANLGQELDLQLKTDIGKDFSVVFLAGLFIPHVNFQKLKKEYYNNIQLTGLYKF